jgi:hypothetical protein
MYTFYLESLFRLYILKYIYNGEGGGEQESICRYYKRQPTESIADGVNIKSVESIYSRYKVIYYILLKLSIYKTLTIYSFYS